MHSSALLRNAALVLSFLTVLILTLSPAASQSLSSPMSADTVVVPPHEESPPQPQETGNGRPAARGVDTVVVYSASDSIVYYLPTRTMTLFAKGDIKYRTMRLKSEVVDINWDTAILYARGVPDTAETAEPEEKPMLSREAERKLRYRGTPVMIDGGEEYRGFELSYNFRTQRGRINLGDTEIDQGYYQGDVIKKVEKDVLFVASGRYTTCDDPEPHYYFFSPKMKVVMQDQVVAEPVYLYVADVPVFALPFGVFPNKSGRRSGIIAPAYGEDARRGRYLSHLGYYWAINDYMDWNVVGDWYTKGGWALYSNYRYAHRYHFSGSLSGEYKNLHTGESGDPDRTKEQAYRLNITHHQDVDPTTRMDVNFTFASNNSYLMTNNLQQALDQAIFSNATLSKYWEGTPNSLTLNVSRRQNLRDGSIDEVLPSVSFNRSQGYPFRTRGSGAGVGGEMAWYELIGYTYSAHVTNSRFKTIRTISGIKTTVDTTMTFRTVEEFERGDRQTMTQAIGINASPKLAYFNITPSLSFREERVFSERSVPQRSADSSLVVVDVTDKRTNGYFSTGISTGTKFYGIVQPNALGVSAIRHTLTPSLSFTYSKQVYGKNLAPRQMFASFNVGNIFEMKTTAEEGKEPQKIQLINLGAGISYNFAADSLNFSPIGVNFRTDVAKVLNISGSSSFDLYKFDPATNRRINKFLIKEEGRLARMTNFSINLSTTLSGERKKGASETEAKTDRGEQELAAGQARGQASGFYGLFADEEPDFSIPWNLTLSWDFSENKVPNARFRSSNMRGSLGFNLTENWKISASGSYDLINKEFAAPSVTIYRDLHCWEMNFNWIPLGTYRSFRLEIRVKAPQLHDVKVTKQGSARGIY